MIKIKISTSSLQPNDPLFLRFSSAMSNIWNNAEFIINSCVDECDWWVVLHHSGLKRTETTYCDPNHVIYISLEPNETVGNVTQGFHDQFSTIISVDNNINHPNVINLQMQPWHIGQTILFKNQKHSFDTNNYLTYDDLISNISSVKKNRISAVISTKNFLPGHKNRLRFIEKLMESEISSSIDLYGAGFQHIDDKYDALKTHKYHLAIENDFKYNYWTEKLTDALIGETLPFYYGCPNIFDYLPSGSLIPIDIKDADASIKILSDALKSNEYEKSQRAVRTAKSLIMNKYNMLNQIALQCSEPAKIIEKVQLKPNYCFTDKPYRSNLKKLYFNLLALKK